MKSILARILVLTIAATGTAWCQQAAVLAQPTLASPQAAPAGPDLPATMTAMEEALRSVGRLTWTEILRFPGKPVSSYPNSSQLVSVAADPKACSLRTVNLHEGGGLDNYAVYLEEITGVDVDTFKNNFKATDPTVSIEPSLYSARVDSWKSHDFPFQTKEAAEQFADLLRESVKQCSAVPVTPRAAEPGSPSLTETISFIADKLTAQGVVSGSVKLTRDDGSWITLGEGDTNISKVYSPATCILRVDAIGMGSAELQLSFRRIGKIEVMKLKDHILASSFYSQIVRTYRNVEWPPTFVLEITAPGGESKELYFSDESLANRVAKAINHAAELCGAGANKEPF